MHSVPPFMRVYVCVLICTYDRLQYKIKANQGPPLLNWIASGRFLKITVRCKWEGTTNDIIACPFVDWTHEGHMVVRVALDEMVNSLMQKRWLKTIRTQHNICCFDDTQHIISSHDKVKLTL